MNRYEQYLVDTSPKQGPATPISMVEGARVRIISGTRYDMDIPGNPRNITGTVSRIGIPSHDTFRLYIHVAWDNGRQNQYHHSDLELFYE